MSGTIYSKYMILRITGFLECLAIQIEASNSRSRIGMWNCSYRMDQLFQRIPFLLTLLFLFFKHEFVQLLLILALSLIQAFPDALPDAGEHALCLPCSAPVTLEQIGEHIEQTNQGIKTVPSTVETT